MSLYSKRTTSEKAFNFYTKMLFPKLNQLRGTTRLKEILLDVSLKSKVKKIDENLYEVKEESFNCKLVSYRDLKPILLEDKFSRLINRETKKSEVFCDVGGYHGFYSLSSKAGKTYCFEADPENYKWIKSSILLNPDKKIEAFNKAVWKNDGTIHLDSGKGTKSAVSNSGITIESVKLDTFFEKRKDPDVIKIDVEGSEKEVIEGSKEVIRRSKPTLFVEVHTSRHNERKK